MNINTDFKLELQEKWKQRGKEQQLKKLEKKTPRESNDERVELDIIIGKEREKEQETERLTNLMKLQWKQEDTRKSKQINDKLTKNRPTYQDSNNKQKQRQKQKHKRNLKE